jgi:hypothetical protein
VSGSSAAVPAAITVNAGEPAVSALLADRAAMHACFGDKDHADGADCSFSLKPAPGDRGTEIHVSSHDRTKERLKAGLRKVRALLEAGEIPTGARR